MWDDLKHAVRSIRRQALSMLVAVLSIAAGIGTVSAITGILSAVIGGAFSGIERPNEVVWLLRGKGNVTPTDDAMPPADYLSVRAESKTLSATAAFRPMGGALAGAGDPQMASGMAVSGDFFSMLGVSAALGRTLGPADEDDGQERALVLGDGFFRRALGANRGVIGQVVQLRGEPYRVVGVMPTGFGFPVEDIDVYVPLRMSPGMRAERGSSQIVALGRLAPGKSAEEASTELAQIAARLGALYPTTNRDMTIGAVSVPDLMLGPSKSLSMLLVLGVTLVLVVACVNAASILFASAAGRQGEMAVRATLGAARGRLVRLLLVEALVIAVLGGALGLALAWLALRGFVATLPSGFHARIPRLEHASLDGVAAAVGGVATLLAAMGAGVGPALRASRAEVTTLLRDGARATVSAPARQRLLGALVGGEVAVAVTLSLFACAALASLEQARSVPLGYDPEQVIEVMLPRDPAPGARGASAVDKAFYTGLTRRVRALPGVESVAFSVSTPLARGYSEVAFADARRPVPPIAMMKWSKLQQVGADYFRVMRVSMREGRSFSEQDDASGAPVAILSRQAARQVFGDESPVGHTILLRGETPCTVIGLVDDVQDPHGQVVGSLYRPVAQTGDLPARLMVRTKELNARTLEGALRGAVRAEDAAQPVARVAALSDLVRDSLWTRRTVRTLLGLLAAIAVGLSLVGVYGVTSRSVAERKGEFSLRAALGATPRALLGNAVGGPARITALGALVGVALLVLARPALTAAIGESPLPPWVIGLATLAVVAASLLASLGPAVRAARTLPADALRG